MLLGHPIVSIPAMLIAVGTLVAGIYGGSALLCLIGMAEIGTVQSARAQARKFRQWKADWDAMAESPPPPTLTPVRWVGIVILAGLFLLGFAHVDILVEGAAYALGWTAARPWLPVGLIAAIVLLHLVRRRSRRVRPAPTVTVIARRVLPVPSLADAYRALPDYCHALLGNQP